MIIAGPTGPEQTFKLFMCHEHLIVYIFFEGISLVTRYCSHFLRRLRPSMYSEYFMMFIYYFFISFVSYGLCVQKCIYMFMFMIFLYVSKMPI